MLWNVFGAHVGGTCRDPMVQDVLGANVVMRAPPPVVGHVRRSCCDTFSGPIHVQYRGGGPHTHPSVESLRREPRAHPAVKVVEKWFLDTVHNMGSKQPSGTMLE